MVVAQHVLGVRRLPDRGPGHEPGYELRFRDGGAASCSLARLEELSGAGRGSPPLLAVVSAADETFEAGEPALVEWPSGLPLATTGDGVERLRRVGGWIESSAGYRVRSTGRAGCDYEDAMGRRHVDAEWLAVPKTVIYADSIPAERPEVLERVTRCWLWAGFDVDLAPPRPWT